MTNLIKATVLLTLILTVSACGVSRKAQPITGGLPVLTDSSARIYFYRSKVPFLAAIEPVFLVDGKSVGKAVMNQVIYRDAKPGEYKITISSDQENAIALSLKPGQAKYIKAYGTTSVVRTYHAIKEVGEEEALKELKGQKLLAPDTPD